MQASRAPVLVAGVGIRALGNVAFEGFVHGRPCCNALGSDRLVDARERPRQAVVVNHAGELVGLRLVGEVGRARPPVIEAVTHLVSLGEAFAGGGVNRCHAATLPPQMCPNVCPNSFAAGQAVRIRSK